MSRLKSFVSLIVLAMLLSPALAKSPFSLISFKRSKAVAQSSRLLTEENGPWMIFVGSFAGQAAEEEARQLVETLRQSFGMKAYLHKQFYDFTDRVEGKGFDKYGRPKQMRYSADDAFEEVAVLVGDYESTNDSRLQKDCLLYTSPSPRDSNLSRMPSSA